LNERTVHCKLAILGYISEFVLKKSWFPSCTGVNVEHGAYRHRQKINHLCACCIFVNCGLQECKLLVADSCNGSNPFRTGTSVHYSLPCHTYCTTRVPDYGTFWCASALVRYLYSSMVGRQFMEENYAIGARMGRRVFLEIG